MKNASRSKAKKEGHDHQEQQKDNMANEDSAQGGGGRGGDSGSRVNEKKVKRRGGKILDSDYSDDECSH